MYCRNCGKEIINNNKFCNNCGANILLPQNPKKRITLKELSVIDKMLIVLFVITGVLGIIAMTIAMFNAGYESSGNMGGLYVLVLFMIGPLYLILPIIGVIISTIKAVSQKKIFSILLVLIGILTAASIVLFTDEFDIDHVVMYIPLIISILTIIISLISLFVPRKLNK